MTHFVEFRLLGALEVVIADRPMLLGGPRQQVVLATLLISHPDPVSNDRLIDAVWGDDPPPTAPTTVQAYVSRLRKLLGAAEVGLRSGARGYRLEIDDDAIDACRFDRAVDEALALAQAERNAEIVALLEPALALWRSPYALGRLGDAVRGIDVSGPAPECPARLRRVRSALRSVDSDERTRRLVARLRQCGRRRARARSVAAADRRPRPRHLAESGLGGPRAHPPGGSVRTASRGPFPADPLRAP
jgi:DNA-binding winged helix-turn-helix (wHTH) protein